jgi:hydroxymethylglutaryl-CoA reductase
MGDSRIPGFYREPLAARRERICAFLSEASAAHLRAGGGLDPAVADRMSENVVGVAGLPLGVALNFRVNGADVLVPMAVEEPSVVAAASNAARMVRAAGGFVGAATPPVMTAQIQLDAVPDAARAPARVEAVRAELLALGDAAIPGMVCRGGGCRDLEARVLDVAEGMVVVHLYVDVGDAMGANLVDAVAEAVAPRLADVLGGSIGLRILSNLPLRRMVAVRGRAPLAEVGGLELARAIERASRFAERDPFRAVTHNKGIMNGVDAAGLALGQDLRALEAGAHAFASLSGTYRPLATWRVVDEHLCGELEMPLAAATIGGSTRAHAGVRAAFELVGVTSARELAVVLGACGLAANLAALRALAGEGIQRGHMKLHERKRALEEPRAARARPEPAQ